MNQDTLQYEVVEIKVFDHLDRSYRALGDQYWLFVGMFFVGVLIASVVPAILIGPIYCGFFLCCLKQIRRQPVQFEMIFRGFDVFVESLVATLLMIAVALVPVGFIVGGVVLSIIAGVAVGEATAGIVIAVVIAVLFALLLIIQLASGVLFGFVYPLIIDRNMQAIPAMKTSFAAAKENFSGLLLLNLTILLLSVVGLLCCYVGAILLLPIHFMAIALVYEDVFPRADAVQDFG